MRILYHISIDDRFKGMFVHTDCIPLVQDPLKITFIKLKEHVHFYMYTDFGSPTVTGKTVFVSS